MNRNLERYNINKIDTSAVDAQVETGRTFWNMALFFINARTREILQDLVQDGYILLALPFVASPGFMARIGCLGAGLAFPIYKTIVRISLWTVASEKEKTSKSKLDRGLDRAGVSKGGDYASKSAALLRSRVSSVKEEKAGITKVSTEDDEIQGPSPSEEVPHQSQWLKYWVVYGFLSLILEANLSAVLPYVPFFYHLQLLTLIWLQLPYFRGATFLHDGFYSLILVPEHELKSVKNVASKDPNPIDNAGVDKLSTESVATKGVSEGKQQKAAVIADKAAKAD